MSVPALCTRADTDSFSFTAAMMAARPSGVETSAAMERMLPWESDAQVSFKGPRRRPTMR
eukprot:CAMPEP_0197461184 /NCGR_PEP_ID=MMETSP1175-20131217/55810_1 /TAXON_ID=1003142 /ORGANISM="Triceratium dubium, Strain CCMP147" /LENGTH=59 /DNA_ID=CAMNT_0042996413 /DNA_START=272 /DNA_END=448 /DNA_ORIENTATION=-